MCRQVPRKNLDGAIRAAATLVECGNRLRFRIAGSGPENKRLHALVDELGMGEHIHLLGRVDDEEIIPLYRSSHVFLHPQIATRGGQDMEGFGLTIADAMSFGCVPIAGASGGPLDFIEHGTSGFLVDGTRQNEIIDALTTLVSDPERRKSIGLTAQAFAQKEITWDMHVTKIIDRLNTDLR